MQIIIGRVDCQKKVYFSDDQVKELGEMLCALPSYGFFTHSVLRVIVEPDSPISLCNDHGECLGLRGKELCPVSSCGTCGSEGFTDEDTYTQEEACFCKYCNQEI